MDVMLLIDMLIHSENKQAYKALKELLVVSE